MRVLIADDSAFMRQALARALSEASGLEVVGRAKDGREAVELARELKPDAVSLDIEMPEMDGLTALRHIVRQQPGVRVLMCSSLTTAGSVQSLQALRMGAADVIAKENGATLPGGVSFHEEYVRRLRALAESAKDDALHTATPENSNQTSNKMAWSAPSMQSVDLIAIGSSTGGPPVLETLLAGIGPDLTVPVIIAQHMPKVFTGSMADRLNELCAAPVVHAEHGSALRAGTVTVCPGGSHAHLVQYAGNQLRIRLSDEPKSDLYYPSVDVLFRTAAETLGKRTLGIVLTGIGEDGAKGAKELRNVGASVVAQDRRSCVVYGMPRSIAEQGLASAVLSPEQMAGMLQGLTTKAAA